MERNWAELPSELLSKIMNRLCITSIDSFKLVCQNWNLSVLEDVRLSLLKPIQSPPWLTISPEKNEAEGEPNSNPDSDIDTSFFSVSNNKVYYLNKKKYVWRPPAVDVARCVGSCHGWLAFIDYLCVIYLTNPFKHDGIVKLPSIETLPCILGIDELSSSPSCINFKYWNAHTDDAYIAPSNLTYNTFIAKLVMSSTPFKDCTVMAIYGELRQIAFCKVGDISWTTLGRKKNYCDLYYSSDEHCFYSLCVNTWSVEVWDLRDSSSPNVITFIELLSLRPPLFEPSMTRNEWCTTSREKMYLTQLHGELLLIVKYSGNVYKNGKVLIWLDEYHEYIKEEEEETYEDDEGVYEENEVDEEVHEESVVDENEVNDECVVDDDEVNEESTVDEDEVNEECVVDDEVYGESVVDDKEVNEESVVDDEEVNEDSNEEDDSDTSSEESDIVRENLPYKTFCFMVYKLDMVKKRWVPTTNGVGDGGDVLFLGINNAIAFSPIEFPQLKRNSIYFADDKYTRILHGSSSYGGHDSGIFSFEDYNIHPCYYSKDAIQILPPPVWISPNPW